MLASVIGKWNLHAPTWPDHRTYISFIKLPNRSYRIHDECKLCTYRELLMRSYWLLTNVQRYFFLGYFDWESGCVCVFQMVLLIGVVYFSERGFF